MPQLHDFLERFRPVGGPGAPGSAGVPANRSPELEAELALVLALLDDVDGECARIIVRAEQAAGQVITAARGEATAQLAASATRARAARDEAARTALAAARSPMSQQAAGASLEYLDGTTLPGLAALADEADRERRR